MFFAALINTVRWLVFDQRKLLAAGFGDREVFELEMFLPNYISRHLSGDLSFHRRRLIFVRDPKLFGVVFKGSEGQLDASSAYAFVKPYFGDKSVLVAQGADHLHAKQAVYNVIRENLKIESKDLMFFGYSITEIFKTGTYPVMRPVQLLTGAFVLRTIFGEQGSALADATIQHAIKETDQISGVFLVLPALVRWTRRLGVGLTTRRAKIALRKFIIRQLDRIAVLDDWKSSGPRGAPINRTEIVDNLMTILIAGFETTAATIAWLLYELAHHPDIQIALRGEILERFQQDPARYLAADSTLLARCVFEGMRLHPALPFVIRQATGDFALGDKTAHQNDYIVLAVEEMHWRHFGQDGLEFRPARFGIKTDLPKTATFGGGTKTCPGRAIAVQEVRTVCALIVSSFNIRLDTATDPRVGRNRISATPKGGMILSLDRITA